MYVAKNNGATMGTDRQYYTFQKGQRIKAPKGALDHDDSVEWLEKEKQDVKPEPVKRKGTRSKSSKP